MHWTRIGLLVGLLATVIGTCMPWLVDVPAEVLTIGSGTIYGIATTHGIIAMVLSVGAVVVVAIGGDRRARLHRGIGAGLIGAAVIAVGIHSLVAGTSELDVLDETHAEVLKATGSEQAADQALIAVANQFEGHVMEMGDGSLVFGLGWALVVLFAIIGMFVRRRDQTSKR